MKLNTLKDLYIHELKDLCSAEKQLKRFPPSLNRPFAVVALMVLGALALPESSLAKPKQKSGSSGGNNHQEKSRHQGDNRDGDRNRAHYHSRPRSTFTLSLGTGYAGRGYYYGPANSPYYYQGSDVRYYATREAAPREYFYGQSAYRGRSLEASVQQALAREGYYRGGIDGQIGPYSRRAIARYQADHGLAPTGAISSSLLRSLRLQ